MPNNKVLTERQRMDLLLVADDMEVSGDANLADALRALLDAPAKEVAEGCTPTDAQMLREANHALAAENDALRRTLRPFANIASTDRLSWAMVEYCVEGDPEKQTFQAPQMQRAFNRAADILRDASTLAAHPGQPEPRASITDSQRDKIERAEECLRNTGRKEDGEAANGLLDVLTEHPILPELRAEVTDEQIADMFERVTGYSLENGRAALNDADILGFARELLDAARAGGA